MSTPLAIVTGGSRGLGFVVAKELAKLGNRVLIVSKDPERATAAAAEEVSQLGLLFICLIAATADGIVSTAAVRQVRSNNGYSVGQNYQLVVKF